MVKRFLTSALVLASLPVFAAEPEVFVHTAILTPSSDAIISRVSYCGDVGNTEFVLAACDSREIADVSASTTCYRIRPKTTIGEACVRVITRTEAFALNGSRVPRRGGTITLVGDRGTRIVTAPAAD